MVKQKPDQAKVFFIFNPNALEILVGTPTQVPRKCNRKKPGLYIAVCAINKPESGKHFMFITSASGIVINGCVMFIKLFRLSSTGSVYFFDEYVKKQ